MAKMITILQWRKRQNNMSDIYRRNAGIVVFNRSKQVLICKRNDIADSWQFPQGGIEKGETPSAAALRELAEETSITNVKLVHTLLTPVRYDFPPQILRSMQKCGFKNVGQEVYWSLCYFAGCDTEIKLNTPEAEFSEYRWTTLQEAYNLIVDFKKPAYLVALNEFQSLLDEYNFS